MKIIKLLIILYSLSIFAARDWRGHNRLLVSDYESLLSQVVINHRSMILENHGDHQFELAYEIFIVKNKYDSNLYSLQGKPYYKYRLEDLNYHLVEHNYGEKNNTVIVQNLDRAIYRYTEEDVEISLGRQVVSFGSARIINPLDILVPHDLLVINSKQRDGVDALRGKFSFSQMGVIDFGVIYQNDKTSQYSPSYISVQETFGQTDIKLLFQSLNKNKIYGLDIQSNLGNWGTWLELGKFNIHEEEDFLRYSLGGQYHFTNDLDLIMEYHHNGSEKIMDGYGIFLSGKNYMNFSFAFPITPIHILKSTFYYNLADETNLISLAYDWSLKEDFGLEATVLFSDLSGSQGEFKKYPQVISIALNQFF